MPIFGWVHGPDELSAPSVRAAVRGHGGGRGLAASMLGMLGPPLSCVAMASMRLSTGAALSPPSATLSWASA